MLHFTTAEARELLPHGLVMLVEQSAPSTVAELCGPLVESTTSVNSTVASTRSISTSLRDPVKNSSISPTMRSLSPSAGALSIPRITTYLAPEYARRDIGP